MANSTTGIVGSLNDEELKRSIDKLVNHVDQQLNYMVSSTKVAVMSMNKSLKSLGDIKVDFGGSADGGSSRRAKAQTNETKAVKETTESYDQLAQAMQKASGKKTKEISYLSIPSDVDKSLTYLVNTNKDVDAQMDAILKKERALVEEKEREAQATRAAAEAQRQQQTASGVFNPKNTTEQSRQLLEQNEKLRRYQQEVKGVTQAYTTMSQAITGALNIGKNEVHNYDLRTASAKQLNAMLKQQQEAYARLNAEQRKSAVGNELADSIQRTSRELQKLRTQQSRPISFDVVNMINPKTLDDMVYKLRQLQSYKMGINLNSPQATSEIMQVDAAIKQLKTDMDKYMTTGREVNNMNNALARSWNYMKNRLAFYFTVGASTAFVKNLIEVRSQYEMNERALGILIDSAERGTRIFNELSQMALVSPYTLIELSTAAKQLTAYDVAAKDVVDTTRRLADMAAAVGIPIERLTYALGQIKAYGYLNSRDNRMFANAGIPLVKQLSDYYTELEGRLVSTADVYDRIKKKQVGYEEVMNVISRMTDEGGKFYDFQAKMAETLKVQLANLTLAWNNMLNAMGEESQGVLVGGIGALKQMFLHWKDIEHILTEVVVALGAYKAYQLVTTRLMGATSASLDAQILAMKRNNAAMLEKQALTRKLTIDELRQVAAQNQVTAADYRNALSGKQLTKQKALLLVALNKNNVQLKAAVVNMGLLTTQEVANITTGKALAIVFKSIGISIRNAALAIKSFMMSNWLMFAIAGAYELIHAYTSANEHIEEINKQATEHAKEAFENIKQYLESDVTSAL